MTPLPQVPLRPSPIPELPLLAGMIGLAFVAGGVAHSLTAALAACVVVAVSWRLGVWLALFGAVVGLGGTLLSAPPAGSGAFYTVLSGASSLLLLAATGPVIYLRRASRALPRSAAAVRHRSTPLPSTSGVRPPRPTPERQRVVPPRIETADEDEGRADPDVIHRYLRDARDALGADEVIFWRHDPLDGSFEPAASSAEAALNLEVVGNPRLMALVRWAATERIVTTNDDSDDAMFVTGPVGKGALLHGALGIYSADRSSLPKERAKPWLGRYASHLAGLLELLEEGRTARRYRDRARTYVQAAERIQNNRDLPALGRAICETAVQVTSASRSAFILWDPAAGSGVVHTVSPGHPIPEQFPVTADSLVATACRERQRFAIPELRSSAQQIFYGQGESKRGVGSIGIVHLERDHASVGAIAVEGDAASQISAVEVETLMLLAT
ncbi:MAG: GAF domain-containing protein, partial [Gemmatimonadota bacterium]|nr:GAF domain-containing protein [Gemmatimonadota bacterium]